MSGKQRHYTLRPSRSLALLLLLLGIGTIFVTWLLPFPQWGLLALTAIVLFWTLYHLSLDANLRLQHACVAFRLEEAGGVVLVLRNGRHVSGKMAATSLVTPYLVILNIVLSEQRGSRNLVILPDAMGKEAFRHLRVALRWGSDGDELQVVK